MYVAFPRAEYYQRVRLPRRRCLFFGCASVQPTCPLLVRTAVGLPGSWRLRCCPCRALRPRRSLQRSGHRERLLLPSGGSTPSASGSWNHEAQSLPLRYGPAIALSTL